MTLTRPFSSLPKKRERERERKRETWLKGSWFYQPPLLWHCHCPSPTFFTSPTFFGFFNYFFFFFNKTNHFIFYFFINIFQENIVIYFEFLKATTKSIWSVLEGKKNTWLWFTLVSCQSIDTRVTPHSSPLIILSTLTNSLIPKTKDKFIIWHLQQHVHGTSFINVPTCMSAVAVWFEKFLFMV